jgi:hypothetical protein
LNGVANTTFKYLEVVDNGNNSIAPGTIGYFSGSNTVTVTHMFARNAGCVYFIPIGNNQSVSSPIFGTPRRVRRIHATHSTVRPLERIVTI